MYDTLPGLGVEVKPGRTCIDEMQILWARGLGEKVWLFDLTIVRVKFMVQPA